MAKVTFPFKNENNQRYSKQLFFESWRDCPVEERVMEPAFTLYLDKPDLINFGKEYVKDEDPSGYTTSTRLLGDFAYWKHLMKAKWFREAVDTWNEELDARLYAKGLSKIREIAGSEEKGALAAAKFLVEEGYKAKDTVAKRGRPSKDEIKARLREAAEDAKDLEEDAKRIGLVRAPNAS